MPGLTIWSYIQAEHKPGCACGARRKRLEALRAVGDPIAARAAEAGARPRALRDARDSLALWRKSAAAWPAAKPWIDAADVAGLVRAVRPRFARPHPSLRP